MIEIRIVVDESKADGEEIRYTEIVKDSSFIENCIAVRECMRAISNLTTIKYNNLTFSLEDKKDE